MSLVSKGFQIFSLLGTVSSVPFIPSLTEKTAISELPSVASGGAKS
ncbi:hypothetical protein [Mycoplasma wenyonii]|nr:hypothetical protein [Mycoplasma wenyonii]